MTASTRWIYACLIYILATISLSACAPVPTNWLSVYSNDNINHEVKDAQRLLNGKYIAAGNHWTMDPSSSVYLPPWLLKTQENGVIDWQFTLGNSNLSLTAATPTHDGGSILTGSLYSAETSSTDMVAVKLDETGRIEWQKRYGGNLDDHGNAAIETSDGSFLIAGDTSSFGASSHSGVSSDAWVLKLDHNGKIIWQKRFGFSTTSISYPEIASFVLETSDHNYLIAGGLISLLEYPHGTWSWIMKLDSNGNILLQRRYGGFEPETSAFGDILFHSIRETNDTGYILATNIRHPESYFDDASMIKLDKHGSIIWKASFMADSEYFSTSDIRVDTNGDYFIAGSSEIFTDGIDLNFNAWLAKVSSKGDILWQQAYDPYRGPGRMQAFFLTDKYKTSNSDRITVGGFLRAPGSYIQNPFLMSISTDGKLAKQCGLLDRPHAQRVNPIITVVSDDPGFVSHDTTATTASVKFDVNKSSFTRNSCTAKTEKLQSNVAITMPKIGIAISEKTLPYVFPPTLHPCTGINLYTMQHPGYAQPVECPIACPKCSFSALYGVKPYPVKLQELYRNAVKLANSPEETVPSETIKHFNTIIQALPIMETTESNFNDKSEKISAQPPLKDTRKLALLQSINGILNAAELRHKVPPIPPQRLTTGDSVTIDISGIVKIDAHNIEQQGSVQLSIKPGLPAIMSGIKSGWPTATYHMDFDGQLAKDGFFDINLYIGGLSFSGDSGQIRLLEWDGTSYHDITTAIDLRKATIKGRTNRLREYIVVAATQ